MKSQVQDEGVSVGAFLNVVDAIEAGTRMGGRRLRERKAGRTQGQRLRRSDKTEQMNIRCSLETKQRFDELVEQFGCKKADVLELAVAALAEKQSL